MFFIIGDVQKFINHCLIPYDTCKNKKREKKLKIIVFGTCRSEVFIHIINKTRMILSIKLAMFLTKKDYLESL